MLAAADPAQPYGAVIPWPKRAGARAARVAAPTSCCSAAKPALFVERARRPVAGSAPGARTTKWACGRRSRRWSVRQAWRREAPGSAALHGEPVTETVAMPARGGRLRRRPAPRGAARLTRRAGPERAPAIRRPSRRGRVRRLDGPRESRHRDDQSNDQDEPEKLLTAAPPATARIDQGDDEIQSSGIRDSFERRTRPTTKRAGASSKRTRKAPGYAAPLSSAALPCRVAPSMAPRCGVLFHTTWEYTDTGEAAIERTSPSSPNGSHPTASNSKALGLCGQFGWRCDRRGRQRGDDREGDCPVYAVAAL